MVEPVTGADAAEFSPRRATLDAAASGALMCGLPPQRAAKVRLSGRS
jgi:hypothetical protein